MDQLRPETFVADAVLLDVTRKKPGEAIDDEDMEAAEEDAGLAVREGEAVILHTNSSAQGRRASKHAFLSENGAQYFEFKRVGMVGIDATSLGAATGRSSTHKILLQRNIPVLEGLCNLDQIDSERFKLLALPLRVNAAVSPVRTLAILERGRYAFGCGLVLGRVVVGGGSIPHLSSHLSEAGNSLLSCWVS